VQQRRRKAREHAWALRVEINTPRRGWWEHAACHGTNIERLNPDDCATCPVRIDCLAAARLEEQDYYYTYYVRGGFHAAARARMWKLLQQPSNMAIIAVHTAEHDLATGIAEPPHPHRVR
jgi:hypothetical protein